MKILLLGATGHTGREVLDVALTRGHEVTAYVRSPHKIQRSEERLAIATGDALDLGRLSASLTGHDAVISTLGLPARQALRPSSFMAESAAATVSSMKRAGVERLAILSAAVLFPEPGLFYAFFSWLLRHHARDLSQMETIVSATDLAWTIARPPRLVSAPSEDRRVAVGVMPERSFKISFRAVARFLVEAIESNQYAHEIVGLAQ
jgi:putative NADH-flavin reductase